MECIILIGLPGSGKSTYVNNINSENQYHVASTDNLIDMYCLKHNINYSEAWHILANGKVDNLKTIETEMFSAFLNAVSENKNIIVDRTNMSIKARNKFLANLPETYSKKAIVFSIPEDELKNRLQKRHDETGKYIPEHVLKMMLNSYEPPSLDEFDIIEHVGNN